jgi:LPS-assembly protein
MTFGLTAQRSLTSDSSGDSGTEIMLRIGFKNLGEFETSGISLGSPGSDNDDDDDEDVDDIREDFEVGN